VKKRRLTWLWILIPVLALFVVSLVLVGVFAWRLASPVDATNEYLALLRDRRFASAYTQRCDAFRAAVPLNEFAGGSESLPAIRHYDIDDVEPGWNDATTRGTVELSDRVIDVTVKLEREDGDWTICEVSPIDRVFDSGPLSP
jgi:hypothetical protein